MVPPIRLWDAGVPNRAALAIMTRNSRMPESLAADLDAECSACLMGARRLGELFDRYGVDAVESCFDAILDRTTATYRREILAKIPVGTWTWEDYAEHDGVDAPRLHTQRITLTRTRRRPRRRAAGPRLRRHRPAGQGPDQPLRRLQRRRLPRRSGWRRSCATSPTPRSGWPSSTSTRASCRSSRCASREPGHAAHAGLPGADQRPHVRHPAAARRAGRGGRQGGGRPDAGRPGDDPLHRRLRRGPRRAALPHARGARRRLRGPLLRRRRGHHPRRPRLPQPAQRVHRGALPVPGRAARAGVDSGGAGRATAAASATRSTSGCCKDGHFMSIADRSILACWGVRGGRAGRPFEVAIDPGGPARARGRRARRRRAGAGRRGHPDPYDGWRRLGRPAGPRPGAGGARRRLAQGLAARPRWPTTASVLDRVASTTTRCGYDAGAATRRRRGPGRPPRADAAVLRPRARATRAWLRRPTSAEVRLPVSHAGAARARRQRDDRRRRAGAARGPDRRGPGRDGVGGRPRRRRGRRRGDPRQRPAGGQPAGQERARRGRRAAGAAGLVRRADPGRRSASC